MRAKQTVAILSATVLSILVVVVIVLFGRRPPTAFPSLDASPDRSIPGSVAFVRGDDERCIYVVRAGGGEERKVYCADARSTSLDTLAWTETGDLAFQRFSPSGDQVVVVDLADGRVVKEIDRSRVSINGQRAGKPPIVGEPGSKPSSAPFQEADVYMLDRIREVRADGSALDLSDQFDGDAKLVVREPDGDTRTILLATGPRDYRFTEAQWSPDGRWILVVDTEERSIVLTDDGDPAPRILIEDVSEVAWFIPDDATYTLAIG